MVFYILITSDIGIELFPPKVYIALGLISILTIKMTMPEATMNKYCRIVFGHPDIWMSNDFRIILPVSISMLDLIFDSSQRMVLGQWVLSKSMNKLEYLHPQAIWYL